MRFKMKRSLEAPVVADPDPRGIPAVVGTIPDLALLQIPLTLRNSDTIPGRLLFTLEGTTLNTAVVEVWTLDDIAPDRQANLPIALTQAEKEARQFYLVGTVALTVGELTELAATDSMPAPGTIYIRVVTVPLLSAVLKVTPAN